MFHILKVRRSIKMFSIEKCKVTFGLKYILQSFGRDNHNECPNLIGRNSSVRMAGIEKRKVKPGAHGMTF